MDFLDWLQILFIYLKLTNQVDWTWGFALWPIWLQLTLGVLTAATGGRCAK